MFKLLFALTLLTTAMVAGSRMAAGSGMIIGETDIPLGADAFAATAACLNPKGCGAEIAYLGPPPNYPFYSITSGLTNEHILDVVPTDLSDEDEMLLEFAIPIRNDAGPDIYLAQADYVGELGQFDTQGINDFFIMFDAGPAWHQVSYTKFAKDVPLGYQTVWYIDNEIKSDAYYLYYHLLDLDDYGFAPGESLSSLTIHGPELPEWPETVGLDVVTVANLNGPSTAPAVAITNPSHQETLTGTVTIAAETANFTANGVFIQLFGETHTRLCGDRTAPYECDWDTTLYPNGAYRIRVIAKEAGGQTYTDVIRVRVESP